jgi:sugar phosphate permease
MTKPQKKVLFTCWITYASFYLLRVNMSVAIPGIIKEFGISKTVMGSVLSALFFAYAAGQFINGQMGDRFNAKKIVVIGLLGSAILNVVFGFTNGFLAGMILIWALNGFFQSMGWAPTVRIVANWFSINQRGKAAGILGSSYQIGNVASWALAGFIVGLLGWRWAFWAPAIIAPFLLLPWILKIKERRISDEKRFEIQLLWWKKEIKASKFAALISFASRFFGLEKRAEDAGFEPVEIAEKSSGFKDTIRTVLKSREIWIVAFGLFGLNIVRYGFLDWAPTYFFEVQKAVISLAAFKAIVFPLAGSIGALSAGWISDKFFQSRRAPMAVLMLSVLVLAIWIFPRIPLSSWVLGLVVLAIIGFLTYGPHMIMVTALPMDLGTKEMASSAAGFIDGWGYVGATLTGIGTGFLLDKFGWNYAFYFWLSGAVIATILMSMLWRYTKKRTQLTYGQN